MSPVRLVNPRNRSWFGFRHVRVLGPMVGLDEASVISRLEALRATSPREPWFRRYAKNGWTWSGLGAGGVAELVRSPVGHSLDEVALSFHSSATDSTYAIEVCVYEGHVLLSVAHVASDAKGVLQLLRYLATGADTAFGETSRLPVARAVLETYKAGTLDARAANNERLPGPRASSVPSMERPTRIELQSPDSLNVETIQLSREACDRLRVWRGQQHPAASAASVIMTLLQREIAAHHRPSFADACVLVDCRRYLPAGVSARGNFVTALWMKGDSGDPAVLSRSISRSVKVGRPVLALAKSTVDGARKSPDHELPAEQAGSQADLSPLHWSLSNLGRTAALENLPWAAGPRVYAVVNQLSSPFGVALTVAEAEGSVWISLTHFTAAVPPAVVRSALDQLAEGALTPVTDSVEYVPMTGAL